MCTVHRTCICMCHVSLRLCHTCMHCVTHRCTVSQTCICTYCVSLRLCHTYMHCVSHGCTVSQTCICTYYMSLRLCDTYMHCVSLCLTVSASHCVGMRLHCTRSRALLSAQAQGVAHHSAVVHFSLHKHKESRNKRNEHLI